MRTIMMINMIFNLIVVPMTHLPFFSAVAAAEGAVVIYNDEFPTFVGNFSRFLRWTAIYLTF